MIYILLIGTTLTSNYEANLNKKGDAVYETSESVENAESSWYSDYSQMVYENCPFLRRGGYNSESIRSACGIFSFISYGGGFAHPSIGFRPVVVIGEGI